VIGIHQKFTVASLLLLAVTHTFAARDYVLAVGSSTVYPFAALAAERVGKATRFNTPQVDARGSGGGFKLFCRGDGPDAPDVALASRAIKPAELEDCVANGVAEIAEIRFGYDGIVFAAPKEGGALNLELRDIYLALAKRVPGLDGAERLVDNPYTRWSEVNPKLPNSPIKVYGPPVTSGTRDVLVEGAVEVGCRGFVWLSAMRFSNLAEYRRACQGIREDGRYVNSGENDNLIVRKLISAEQAVGVFGFSFFDQNRDKLRAARIAGVEPSFETLYDQSYPLVRPLYIYVRVGHIGWIPGLDAFLREMVSEQAVGEDGYLIDRGLVPLPARERRLSAEKVARLIARS
jgi:phosphate transport system substrate-binding protein